jgi:hypothetical protein
VGRAEKVSTAAGSATGGMGRDREDEEERWRQTGRERVKEE